MEKNKEFPLYKHIQQKPPVVYNKGEFTLEPMMRGIYQDWKNKTGWYDHVEKHYKENGKHPDWFQKLIDQDNEEIRTEKESTEQPKEKQ